MSTMPISLNALAAVRETLISSYYWRVNDDNHCAHLFDAFCGSQSHEYLDQSTAFGMVEDFVSKAWIYNAIAYFKGKQAKSNEEPAEWNCALEALKSTNEKKMTLMQFYKTALCVDYNTDVDGWLLPDVYENWKRKDDYRKFKKTLARIMGCLSEYIICRTPEYKAAKWDY